MFFYKKMFIRKSGSNGQNRKKIQKSIFHQYCIHIAKMEFKLENTISTTKMETILAIFSVKVKKNLRKSQAQFWEKLRKLRLRQNDGFLIKQV